MNKYVGIDLGGTNIAAGIVTQDCKIISKMSIKTQSELPFEKVVENIANLVFNLLASEGLTIADIKSVGMGSPSSINPKTGLLVHANNMNWKNVPLQQELEKYIKKPLYIRNDADCAALGEALAGAAMECTDVLMVTLGTGVGGGIIINKQIFNGGDNMGAEVGHTKLIFGGVQCTCGQYGCFESYASATALINQTRDGIANFPNSLMAEIICGDINNVSGRTAFDAAEKGDETAKKIVEQYISYVAAGIATLVVVLRPQMVIIGGGISHQGESLFAPLNEKIAEYTYAAEFIGVPKAVPASLGNDAGIIGAAMIESTLK